MQRSIPTGRTSFRMVIVVCFLFAGLTNSGCVTTLGYLPDDIKPADQTKPTYKEVVQWGTDLKDGYGSRATANRNAIYGGAIIAAAAVSAMTGLAAFSTTNGSTILGIGIGTGFLASTAAIYSNDLKAKLYDNASSYMDRLLIRSQARLKQRQSTDFWISQTVLDAQSAKTEVDQKSTAAQTVLDSQTDAAKTAHAKADAETDEAKKKALNEAAQSIDKLVATAKTDLNTAKADASLAGDRLERAKKLDGWVKANPKLLDAEPDEAQCLRGEIRAAIDKVMAHLEELTPQKLVDRFNAASSFAKSKSDPSPAVAMTGLDFSDLKDLEKSACPIP